MVVCYTPPHRNLLRVRPKKRDCLFPVTVRKNRVGRSVKKKFYYFFGQKCLIYACFALIGSRKYLKLKKLEGRDFWNKKLVRVGLQETNNFF